jgi:hypothetical protein
MARGARGMARLEGAELTPKSPAFALGIGHGGVGVGHGPDEFKDRAILFADVLVHGHGAS